MKVHFKTKDQSKNSAVKRTKNGIHDPDVEHAIKSFSERQPEAQREAELLTQTKKPDVSETEQTPFELSCSHEAQGVIERIKSLVGGAMQACYQRIERLKKEALRLGLSIENRQKDRIDALDVQEQKALDQHDSVYQEKRERNQEEISFWHEKRNQTLLQYNRVSEEAQYAFPPAFYACLMVMAFLGEAPQLYSSFLTFGWNIIVVALLVVGVSGSQCLISHFLGLFIKQEPESPQKKKVIYTISVAMVLFFLATGLIRIAEASSALSLVFFTILNAILFFVATWASKVFHPKEKEAFQKKKRIKREFGETEKGLAKAEEQGEKIERDYEAERFSIQATYKTQIETLETDAHPLVREYESECEHFFALWQYGQAAEKQVVAIRDITIQRFRHGVYSNSVTHERPQYWSKPNPELTLYFESFTDFFSETNEAQPSSEPVTLGQKANGFKNAAFGLVVLIGSLFSGCQMVNPDTVTSKVVVAIDVTDSIQVPLPETATHIWELLEQVESGQPTPNKYEVELFLLEDISLNHTYRMVEQFKNVFENPHEIESKKEAFVVKLEGQIRQVLSQSNGHDQSLLYYPICTRLNQLAKDQAHYKKMVVFSNLLENNAAFSVYSKEDLERLQKDLEGVQKQFSEECSLEDMSSIQEVYFIHRPNASTDQSVQQMQRIYRTLLEQQNTIVFIQANL